MQQGNLKLPLGVLFLVVNIAMLFGNYFAFSGIMQVSTLMVLGTNIFRGKKK